jgi:hypothetical protein
VSSTWEWRGWASLCRSFSACCAEWRGRRWGCRLGKRLPA